MLAGFIFLFHGSTIISSRDFIGFNVSSLICLVVNDLSLNVSSGFVVSS